MKKKDVKEMAVAIEKMNQDYKNLAEKYLSAMEISNIEREFLPLSLHEKMVVLFYRFKIDFRATPLQCLRMFVGTILRDGEVTIHTSRMAVGHEFRCFCELLSTVGVNFFESEVNTFGPYTFLNIEDTVFAFLTAE
ncbi:MAG: hypothetical protein PHQ13_03010 [Rhodoferax sp.]|nr:hypothetical protein [Rhodoferax sp.]